MPLQIRLTVLACLVALAAVARPSCADDSAPAVQGAPDPWQISADFNAIGQFHGRVAAPLYLRGSSSGSRDGIESLTAQRENSHSLVAGLNLGLRLGGQGELWVRPEAISGIPLSGASGLAAFTNSDTQKFMVVEPTFYAALIFLRYSIDLGGASERVEPDGTTFARALGHEHLILQAGKMDLLSLFDGNSWAHKGADRFLNWCFMTSCAYDFAADARGYAIGGFAEYQSSDWSLRGGRFTMPKVPNQLPLDWQLFRHYGDNVELERRFEGGAVRLLAYHNHMRLASYGGYAGVLAPIPTAQDGNDPALPNPRVERDKYGVGLNAEYSLRKHLGLFGRVMVTSANTETNAFTEADHSAQAGLLSEGALWRRPFDSAGIALAVNAAGGERRRYLERWLPSLLIGDGQQLAGSAYYSTAWYGPTASAPFHYGPELVAEVYYLYGFSGDTHVTFDLQRIAHPAYNRDRGPADVFGIRVHSQF